LAFQSVNRIHTTKWWCQLVRSAEQPQRTSGHQVMTWYVALRQSQKWRIWGRWGRRRDEVGQITWCFATQATVSSHAQFVLNTLLDRKPMMIAKQTCNVFPPGRAGNQTNGSVANKVQALNVAVRETSDYDFTVVEPAVYQSGVGKGRLMDLICLRVLKLDDNTWLMWVLIVMAPSTYTPNWPTEQDELDRFSLQGGPKKRIPSFIFGWKNFTFARHKFLLVTLKEWLKSVLNYRSYPKNKSEYPFLDHPVVHPRWECGGRRRDETHQTNSVFAGFTCSLLLRVKFKRRRCNATSWL